jgi:hypothetical protein
MVEELNQHSKEHGRHLEELEAQLDKLENDLEKNELEKKGIKFMSKTVIHYIKLVK